MGNPQSGLQRLLNNYTENDALIDPSQTSSIKIYFSKTIPDYVMIHKTIDFTSLGLKADILPSIKKRAEGLPIDCLPGQPEYNNKIIGAIDVSFLTGSMNLNDFVLIKRHEGKPHMSEPDVRYLLDYLIEFGAQMQQIGEYHYLLNMSNIFVTTSGLKIQNPFIYKTYISDSQRILDQFDVANQPGGFSSLTRSKIFLENKIYCDKVRHNVRQVGLVVLFSALHKHDTNLTDEQHNLDEELISANLEEFKTRFSKPLGTRIESMIKLKFDIINLPLFSQIRESAPGRLQL